METQSRVRQTTACQRDGETDCVTASMDARTLPIYELEARILDAVRREGRLIVQAPTGSGKSTQLPQMLLAGDVLDGSTVVVSAGMDGLVIGDRIVPSARERPASVVVH